MTTISQATANDGWFIVPLGRHWSLYHSYCVGKDGETMDPCAFTGWISICLAIWSKTTDIGSVIFWGIQ